MTNAEGPAFGPVPLFAPERLRTGAALSALLMLISACSASGSQPSDEPTFDDKAEAAEALCPVMWETYRAIGDAFNRASLAMKDLPLPPDRRARWERALVEMEASEERLAATIEDLDIPVLDLAKEQILEGIGQSRAEIDDIRQLFTDFPEIDEQRHQARTQQIVVRVAKVIDLIKPEMSAYQDAEIIEAFRSVPECQHAVKDVDDGIGRANG